MSEVSSQPGRHRQEEINLSLTLSVVCNVSLLVRGWFCCCCFSFVVNLSFKSSGSELTANISMQTCLHNNDAVTSYARHRKMLMFMGYNIYE